MTRVTIHRCPVCDTIKGRADELVAALRNDPDLKVTVVDGGKGEFAVDVDGHRIEATQGDSLRDASELATEIRGVHAPSI